MRAILVSILLVNSSWATVWTVGGPAARANITGGPWVLAEGASAFPSPNPGTNSFQPYYQAQTVGTDGTIQGYFDYRVKDLAEAVVAARSTDGGKSWTFQSQVLSWTTNDAGEGHPFVTELGGQSYLYTLDRATGFVDSAGLFVHSIAATAGDPLAGAPAAANPGSTGQRTVGLTTPDGIIAVVPGAGMRILYLAKDISQTPNVVSVHLADTADGVHFTNDTVVSGLVTSTLPFVGPRGTLLKYPDGHYGLFFSGGLTGEDADAFHFLGYAESNDLMTWTVVNDVDHPFLSTDATKDPTGGQPWYAGRIYAPSVTFSADGCTGTMMFSGYKALKPKDSLGDYRQIGVVSLHSCTSGGTSSTTSTTGGTTSTTGGTTSTTGSTTSTTGGTTSGTTSTTGGTTSGTSSTTGGTGSTGSTSSSTGGTTSNGGTTGGTSTTNATTGGMTQPRSGCELVAGESTEWAVLLLGVAALLFARKMRARQ
jgi:hypothetical protein